MSLPDPPIFLANGYAGPDAFPGEVLAEYAADVLRSRPEVALQYGPVDGLPEVRALIAGWLRDDGQASVTADDVLVVPGAKQGLSILARALRRPGPVLTSTPTYMTALGIFRSQGLTAQGIGTDDAGLCTDQLEHRLAGGDPAAFLYTMTDFHNPTGSVMTAQRRTELVRIAERFDLPVLEDNPYRWLRFNGAAVPPLASFGGAQQIASVGSFSKILAPGLRLAWMVVSGAMREKLAPFGLELAASPLTQLLVHRYFSRVPLHEHLARTTALYRAKRDTALAALEAELAGRATWTHPDGGYYVWLQLDGLDTDEVSRAAAEAGAIVYPGSAFLPDSGAGDRISSHVRVNYAHETTDRIARGIAVLAQVVRDRRAAAGRSARPQSSV